MLCLRMARFTFLLALIFILSGCSVQPDGSDRVFYQTSSPRWLDPASIKAASHEKGVGYLLLPSQAVPPYPAIIISHSSLGVGTLEEDFARMMNERGYAVLIVDSFTLRGVHRISDDQTVVSEASMLADLYAAYEFLSVRDDIDTGNISVVGFSKGALPALYSAFTHIHTQYGYETDPFRAHLAFYPWCGLHLKDWHMSAPAQIHSGAADNITPASLCRDVAEHVKAQYPKAPIEFFAYEGQRHAFTHPKIGGLKLPVGYPYPKDCLIEEQDDGSFTEISSGQTVTAGKLSEIINGCSVKGAWVSGDEDARDLSYRRAVKFLEGRSAL